jgi:hypothetical protein
VPDPHTMRGCDFTGFRMQTYCRGIDGVDLARQLSRWRRSADQRRKKMTRVPEGTARVRRGLMGSRHDDGDRHSAAIGEEAPRARPRHAAELHHEAQRALA